MRRPLLFGEVLFDRFPDGSAVLGGAPFNVAWNLQGLGCAPLFVSRVGADAAGRRVLAAMAEFGMDTSGVQLDAERPTGAVEVRLQAGEPSYEIAPGQAWDHLDAAALPEPAAPALLCHGTLALRSAAPRAALARLAAAAPRRIVDVNLRAPWWDRAEVLRTLQGAHTLKLNEHELRLLADEPGDLEAGARQMLRRHGLERIVVTRGAAGAFGLARDGAPFAAPAAPVAGFVDAVGAGDAFTSVLVAAECAGWSFELALRRALELAAAVVGLRGATSSRRDFYSGFRERWDLR